MDCRGTDGAGKIYESPQELWDEVAASRAAGSGPRWYDAAVTYWDEQEASNNGVLGGFEDLSGVDIQDSTRFLKKVLQQRQKGPGDGGAAGSHLIAADCGAGIGRVAQKLLLHFYEEVDLVEPSAHLLQRAREILGSESSLKGVPSGHRAVNFFQAGLEEFDPEPSRYDALWCQWAVMYLTDDDAVAFLKRCAGALRPGGLIFIKENVCTSGFIVDRADCSITRSHKYFLELFAEAGLTLQSTAVQTKFPSTLFKVRMYALAAAKPSSTGAGE